uniref:FYVE-type domain-containing protein n=1 Tax=Aureoumbra lagunensis TaxID=44058 RepID=A0A7S3NMI8_9STRA|mmetsp:Transcript_65/g.76  ORF Transcript_65/g.76 Transcript_65/m.76 type:complete len:594 (-) Transcript_65:347-2128(-)|eukprot:CAMPEP_0197309826 /NCGR_PEP_ID=MMETSP0891-20130614/8446_1 /TAXON_ID=44058 ORGANISM="Aureoumbra lagunensis, Strain CCMP1510" /NCGR_SAMPLE_ID=MMETSP0891 /ASSEMBLY_ACC=CAM_ASM_000534 /LENGTH=593 /DNA_ID=CAMNT_0042795151 /DNA_START=52 /DNA_END=1833 /DNA_ORIENTATION=-
MSLTARKPAPDEKYLRQQPSQSSSSAAALGSVSYAGASAVLPKLDPQSSVGSPTTQPWPCQPPAWVDDRTTERCMGRACVTTFDAVYERRHHCRFCGNIFCQKCSARNAMLPPEWTIKEPQRVCDTCFVLLAPYQATWVKANANAERENMLDEEESSRYMNSPLRFTLGGEIRKAAYTLYNLTDPTNVNYWERDVEYTTELLEAVEGLLFMTVGKVAFIGGVRIATGLIIARQPDGSWSAPCAVGSFGITFGACLGAEVTDSVTGIDRETMLKLANHQVSNVTLGGEASLALGPFGRTAAGEVHLAATGPADHVEGYMSYSQSRGAFGGVTVEAAYLKVRDDVNEKFYGYAVNALHILDGTVPRPKAAKPLYDALDLFYAQVFPDSDQPMPPPNNTNDHLQRYDPRSHVVEENKHFSNHQSPPVHSYNNNLATQQQQSSNVVVVVDAQRQQQQQYQQQRDTASFADDGRLYAFRDDDRSAPKQQPPVYKAQPVAAQEIAAPIVAAAAIPPPPKPATPFGQFESKPKPQVVTVVSENPRAAPRQPAPPLIDVGLGPSPAPVAIPPPNTDLFEPSRVSRTIATDKSIFEDETAAL